MKPTLFSAHLGSHAFRVALVLGALGFLFWFTPCLCADTQLLSYDAQGNVISVATAAATVGPTIIGPPTEKLAPLGGRVSFSVVAAGTGPLAYQWRFNNSDIAVAGNPSAGTSTLTLTNLSAGDFGNYSVRVTNSAGPVTSQSAALRLDSVGDGIPDDWKIANFGPSWQSNPNAAANADADGDGFTNSEEYADGTDPNNIASHFYRLIVVGNVLVQPAASRYAPGAVVTLTAQTQGDLQFSNWSTQDLGSNTAPVSSAANPLVLTMNTSYTASALYGTLPLENAAVVPSLTANNHSVRAESFLTQADGKLVVGGTFDAVTGVAHRNIARFNSDGSLDATFNASTDSTVVSIVQQADGKLLIAGFFGVVNNVSRTSLARLNSDGTLDPTFTTNFNNFVHQVVYRASDSKILAVGGFNQVNGTPSSGVVLLNANGSVDGTFAIGSGANNNVWGVVWQPDGKVVIGGDFDTFNGTPASRLARLNSNGALDVSFTASADSTVYQIARRPSDGDLWVAGNFGTIDGALRRGIARLRASDGGFVPSVNTGAGLNNNGVNGTGLILQTDGKAVIGGNFSGVNGSAQSFIARLNPDGSLDSGYTVGGIGIDNQVYGVGLDAAGNTLIGGTFNFINGSPHLGLARLRALDGNLDSTLNISVSSFSQSYAVATQPNGAMLVGGPFNVVNGVYRPYVARLNPDGTLDTAFNAGSGPNNYVRSIAVGGDGKVVIGGDFDTVNGQPNSRVARFNADGTFDSSFQVTAVTNNTVATVAIQRDGKVLAGGDFTQLNGAQRQRLGRLNVNGSVDAGFVPVVDGTVNTILVQPDTKVLVGGSFNNLNGTPTGGLARSRTDGTLDPSFTLPLPNSTVFTLAVQPDGKILVGGRFTILLASDLLANRLARLNPDGSVDRSFRTGTGYGTNGDVFGIGVQSDGHIVVGGNFGAVSDTSIGSVARLNSDGSLDRASSFMRSSSQPNGQVFRIATQPSDAVLLAGTFSTIGDQSRPAFARFVTTSALRPGAITLSPVGPLFAAGASVTLSITPISASAPISGVSFESSSDGVQFQFLGTGLPAVGGTWTYSVPSLPPGVSFFRAVVTNNAAELARSNAAGPLTTPPVVTSVLSATGYAGSPFSFAASATNPLTAFTATGLPAWATATFDANLGQLLITGTPNAPGVSNITLSPANAAGSISTPLTLTVFNRFASWAANNFTAAELNNPNISGPLGDATGAGLANLIKYALGIPPHLPGIPPGLPVVSVQTFGGVKYLTLTYTHDKSATDVALTVQVSGNLTQPWNSGLGSTVEVSRTNNGNGTETVVTRDIVPVVSANQRFIRLEVTQVGF